MACNVVSFIFCLSVLHTFVSSSSQSLRIEPKSATGVIYVHADSPAVTCISNNSSVSWLNSNGDKLQSNHLFEEERGVLMFTRFTAEIRGNYTCKDKFSNVTVIIDGTEGLILDTSFLQSDYYLVENGQVQKQLFTVTGYPAPTLVLYKNQMKMLTNNWLHRSPNGSVYIDGLITKNDEGRYKIKVKIVPLSNTKEVEFRIHVQKLPKVAPDFERLKTDINSTTRLDCNASGDSVHYAWLKNGRKIQNSSRFILKEESKVLTIKNVAVKDKGIISCVASNKVGNVTKHFDVGLNPAIISFEDAYFVEGNAAIITCRATGYPLPDIRLKRINGTEDDDVAVSDIGHEIREATLKIVNATLATKGRFVCNVSNEDAYIFKEARLLFAYSPKVSQNNLVQVILVNKSAALHCEVYSPTPVSFEWSKDGNITYGVNVVQDNFSSDVFRNILLVEYTDPSVLGEYKCNASNKFGYGIATINLIEGQVPARPSNISFHVSDTEIHFIVWTAEVNDLPLRWMIVNCSGKVQKFSSSQKRTTGTISHLKPNTRYNVTFTLVNAAGTGPVSEIFQVTTAKVTENDTVLIAIIAFTIIITLLELLLLCCFGTGITVWTCRRFRRDFSPRVFDNDTNSGTVPEFEMEVRDTKANSADIDSTTANVA